MITFAPRDDVSGASFNEPKGFAFPGVENHFLLWRADLINHFRNTIYFWMPTIEYNTRFVITIISVSQNVRL